MSRLPVHTLAFLVTVCCPLALLLSACSSPFSSCEAHRDCAKSGGSGGDDSIADAGDAGDFGAPGHSVGVSGDSAVAQGGPDDGGAGGASGGDAVDITPPTILEITPENGASGLTLAKDIIKVTFSEPMDRGSTEDAFVTSEDAPLPTFDWNAAGTELTIDPNLTYPTSIDPAAAGEPFKFIVTTAAKDLAGNSLKGNVRSQFTLLRKVTQVCPLSSAGSWMHGDAMGGGGYTTAGDQEPAGVISERRGFITADISSLPSGIVEFESARIDTSVVQVSGDPFGSLGDLLIDSVVYQPPVDQTAFDVDPLHKLGTFVAATVNNAAGDSISKDVLVAVKDDYENRIKRKNRSQYRLAFALVPNPNGQMDFVIVLNPNLMNDLTVEYLLP